jgi:hypothetical protein
MRYLIPICAAAFLFACSTRRPRRPTPLSGSPVVTLPPSTLATSTPSTLNWDRIRPGRPAESAPTPIPDGNPTTLEQQRDGSLYGVWWPYISKDGRDGMLSARFVARDGAYVLCWWDTSDL